MTNIAPVKWAQRKDSIYLTINLNDVKDHKVELTNAQLIFEGNSNGKPYILNLEFFKEIEAEGSIWNVLPSSVHLKLNKKDKESEFWPRLLKDKNLEKTNVKIDWDRYVDEDEAEGKDFDLSGLDGGTDFGGMDFGNLGGGAGGPGGFGAPGGFGGGEDESDEAENEGADSDDDEQLPDLESTEEQPTN